MKVTEIKVTTSDGVCIIRPSITHLVANGKTVSLDQELSKQIWKEAVPWIDKFINEVRKRK
jgi:ribosomal protein L31E